jgi:nucleotide-binding universal stress UspA family protein
VNDHGVVLVGLGDAADGVPELEWAAAEAKSTHRTLRVVRAWHLVPGLYPWANPMDRMIEADLRKHATERLAAAREHLRDAWPGVDVDARVVKGPAGDVLVDMSGDAHVTVVGSRRLGAMAGALVGSVSTVVAARAHGPVVVVEAPAGPPADEPSVVVGVDGSAGTQDVLAFAFDQASRRDRALRAVFCLRLGLFERDQASSATQARAQRWLAEMLAGWQEKYPDVRVRHTVSHEHPVEALVAISTSQELLVVGGRSRHARVGPLLGSVSQGVLHHAVCPVAVVHAAT